MHSISKKSRFYFYSFLKHDFRSSITVFFVALPLCLGIALASGVPIQAGIIAGIAGGLIVPLISRSELSVSGPAAGLTVICAAAVISFSSIQYFFIAVALAGVLQIALGVFKLGGFTQFIPSSVIKGMLAAIGIILISKQIPLLLGYDRPDFWTHEFINLISFNHGFKISGSLSQHISVPVILISLASIILLALFKKILSARASFIPVSLLTVVAGSLIALLMAGKFPALALASSQFVSIPSGLFSGMVTDFSTDMLMNKQLWQTAVTICFVASLESLLSIVAIDKLDPYNRITPLNRELIAQGSANIASGLFGGLPVTAVIVRSSANAEANARTRLSAFLHGLWLLIAVLLLSQIIGYIPYCVLAVLLLRTGYNLAKPSMIRAVFKQGREQFYPFIITVAAILFTDMIVGVLIGVAYALYFMIKHTYRAGYRMTETKQGAISTFQIELALNVSFLNKSRIAFALDKIPSYSEVIISGEKSVYIDHDILEIIQDFKSKARRKHISLTLKGIPDVTTIELH